MNILYILLALGIIGHAINMYCDRILSIFPNGTLKLANYSNLKDGDYAAKLMEGVSPSVPMRSGVLGVFAIVLEFCGYAALAAYAYQKAPRGIYAMQAAPRTADFTLSARESA